MTVQIPQDGVTDCASTTSNPISISECDLVSILIVPNDWSSFNVSATLHVE